MHAYLLCQLVELFENDNTAESNATAATKRSRPRGRGGAASGGGTKRRTPTASTLSLDWPTEASNAVTVLDQLCKLDIRQLWDPPVVEEDFVNLLANCCFKLLENKVHAGNGNVREAITNLLMILIQRYKHGMACCVKLVQLLQCFVHMTNCLTLMVNQFMEKETMAPFVKDLLNEICSYKGEDLERDSTGTHNFCVFLESVSSSHSSLATSILPLIKARLSEDPYQMRNCALTVIGEVLRNLCKHPQLEGDNKIHLDHLMNVLQEHIHDVNGFVRSKSLQIWCNIAQNGGLPVKRQAKLARLLVGPDGAINDVTSFARKYALRLLTTILVQSPAVTLSPEILGNVLKKEQDRLAVIEESFAHINPDNVGLEDPIVKKEEIEENEETNEPDGGSDATDDEEHPLNRLKRGRKGGRRTRTDSDSGSDAKSRDARKDSEEKMEAEEDQGISKAAAALEAVIHSAALIAQTATVSAQAPEITSTSTTCEDQPMSAEVAFEVRKAELVRQRACVAYLKDMQKFAGYMMTGVEGVKAMLHAKTVTDVLEAIEFFLTAKQAGVKNLDTALRHMLAMIWSQEESIRKAVRDACRRLYFQPDMVQGSFTEEGRLSPAALSVVISTLVRLVSESTLGDLVSLERILHELLELGHVDEDLKSELWTRYLELAVSDASIPITFEKKRELKVLLILLRMITEPSKSNLLKHLNDLVTYGLCSSSKFANVDLECAMHVCMLIQKMVPTIKSSNQKLIPGGVVAARVTPGSRYPEPFRLPPTHPLCVSLRKLLTSSFSSSSKIDWIPLMEQAVATIFLLIETPTVVLADVIRELAEIMLKNVIKTVAEDEEVEVVSSQTPQSTVTVTKPVPSYILTRFLALAGHVAIKMLVHLEFSILNELKRREALQEEKKIASKKPMKTPRSVRPSRVNPDISVASVNSTGGNNNESQSAVDDEAGLLGAVADDAEADYIRQVLNNEVMLQPDHLLARLLPFVSYVCGHPNKYSDPDLQAAASLALVKFMLLSTVVCEQNLQLLFTLAERSPSEVVRANLIVGLGDLARRFPNLIEPWTPNLYARLRDTSPKVRINALNTLSHLILNDMVKVKGQISEMTVCLVDKNDRLKQLSRLFFRELAQKGNSLYNVMPDIVSRLSDPEVGVDETKFRLTVDFLFPLIEKERLCETLVEKICTRFRVVQTERQSRDLGYCLKVMSFNERMVHILQENLPLFAQQLSILDVYTSFSEILANAKKNAKADFLPQLEEFEAKMNEFHQKGVADEEAVRRAEIMAKKASNKVGRRKTMDSRKSTRKGNIRTTMNKVHVFSDDEEETNCENRIAGPSEALQPSPRRTRTRATRGRPTRTAVFSSDEDE